MRILKTLVILVAILGGVLTFPSSVINPFTPVFLGFLGLLWVGLRMGKKAVPPEAPQTTHAGL